MAQQATLPADAEARMREIVREVFRQEAEDLRKEITGGELGRLRYVRNHGFCGDWTAGLDTPMITTDEPYPAVEPEFPELARRARIQGKVILQVVVRKDGTVGDIQVFKEPAANLGFSDAAINAVSQWRYHPARQNGRPVDVFITVVVNFTIE